MRYIIIVCGVFLSTSCTNNPKDTQVNTRDTPRNTRDTPHATDELRVATSLDEEQTICLAVTNQSAKKVPLKDISLCIEADTAYRRIIKNPLVGFIILGIKDSQGHDIFTGMPPPMPDAIKVPHRPLFQASEHYLQPQEKITILIAEDVADVETWQGVTLTFQLKYNNKTYRTQVTFPSGP